ncbi:MAG: Sortase family protein [Marmoricola sp.]|nr:Sortase family protein [Marmoricola sp.]
MTEGKAGDHIAGLSKRLVVLFLAMVIAGFAIPSPGIAGGPDPGPPSLYHPLGVPSKPELLVVPEIGLRAPVLPIEVDSQGVLTPPSDFHEVGWWQDSAEPGSATGETLMTGHTVHTGGGVMNELGEMRPGALVQVRTAHGTVDYRTTKVFVYTKAQLAKHKDDLFGQDHGNGRLVLVTCIGWTGHDYTSNVIVFADQLGVRNDDPLAKQHFEKTNKKHYPLVKHKRLLVPSDVAK